MVVEEVMSRDPIAVEVTESIGQALAKLAEADIRHLPVVEDGALVGIVSDRDLRAFTPAALTEYERPDVVRERLEQAVATVMAADVFSVDPEAELSEVVELMLDHKVGAVPVVEPDGSRLVGIVSYMDVLRVLADQL